MQSKEAIVQIIYDYMQEVFVNHNIEKASDFLMDDMVCCDITQNKFMISKEEVVKNLYEKTDQGYENCSLQIKEEVVRVDDSVAVFMGKIILIRRTILEEPMKELNYSATLIYREGWKIAASHYSEAQKSESFDLLEKNISGGILSCYMKGERFPLRYVNENITNQLGYTKEEFWEKYGENAVDIVYKEDLPMVFEELSRCLEEGIDWRFIHRVVKKDGDLVHFLVRGRKSIDPSGEEIITNSSIDITDLYLLQERNAMQAEELEAQNEELYAQASQLVAQQESLEMQNQDLLNQAKKLQLSEKRFRIALSQSRNIIFDYDILQDHIVRYDLKYTQADKVISVSHLVEELMEGESTLEEDRETFQSMFDEIKNKTPYTERNIRTFTTEKELKWYKVIMTSGSVGKDDLVHAIGVVEDITKQIAAETDLRYQAEYDSLTKVYNKRSAVEKIEEKLDVQEGQQRGAFMMLDVDQFKGINDTFGHPFGDTVLKDVSEVLKNNFCESDVVGRFGGDEFCIFITGTKNRNLIQQKAELINQEIRKIPLLNHMKKNVSVSIGITTCGEKQKNFAQIYKEADDALYGAKKKGRDTFCFYEECTEDVI